MCRLSHLHSPENSSAVEVAEERTQRKERMEKKERSFLARRVSSRMYSFVRSVLLSRWTSRRVASYRLVSSLSHERPFPRDPTREHTVSPSSFHLEPSFPRGGNRATYSIQFLSLHTGRDCFAEISFTRRRER